MSIGTGRVIRPDPPPSLRGRAVRVRIRVGCSRRVRPASRHRGVIATSRPQENLVPTPGYHALLNQQKLWTGTFFLLTSGTLYGFGVPCSGEQHLPRLLRVQSQELPEHQPPIAHGTVKERFAEVSGGTRIHTCDCVDQCEAARSRDVKPTKNTVLTADGA